MSITQPPSKSTRRLPLNWDQITSLLWMVGIILVLVGIWEGSKAIGKANDYSLDLGFTTVDMSVTRNINMPHLKDIFGTYSKPAQRNGPPLIEVLLDAALFTFREAVIGFVLGTALGLLLAVAFVHSNLMERGLMPFVIGSQTVPILAIAPMIVIWAAKVVPKPLQTDLLVKISSLDFLHLEISGQQIGVSIIAAYLAFFPVTIYALRGLSDVPQTALELMESYAASRWEILVKLRFPNALPYIFTALKITAPASVVGAVIGELPAGIQDGLGGAILNYAQYYTSNPPQLWATNVITALVGILFFVIIAVTEKLIVRWKTTV